MCLLKINLLEYAAEEYFVLQTSDAVSESTEGLTVSCVLSKDRDILVGLIYELT